MGFFGEEIYKTARKKRLTELVNFNKDYYRLIEDYDWVRITSSFRGPETFYHRIREKTALKYISSYLGKNSKKKVLDAGCGTGLILRRLPKNSIGIDINPRHIEKAKINAPNSIPILGDIEGKTRFKKNAFDLIVCFETLEHLIFPEKTLAEFKRILKKNGHFIGSVPRRSIIWRLRGLTRSHPHNEPFHREFTKQEISDLLSAYFKKTIINSESFGMNFFFICKA